VHVERTERDGTLRPGTGTITCYEPPTGPGVRVDGCAFAGWRISARYDPLVAKVIVTAPATRDALIRTERTLGEMRLDGVDTNVGFLRSLLRMDEVQTGTTTTTFIDDAVARIVDGAAALTVSRSTPPDDAPTEARREHDAHRRVPPGDTRTETEQGYLVVRAPLIGTVVTVEHAPGAQVARGAPLVVLEAMKMEHVVDAPASGVVRTVAVTAGMTVAAGTVLATLAAIADDEVVDAPAALPDPDAIRPDLARALAQRRLGRDEARPEAVARRRRTAQRTARENIADLCDPESFSEYGALAIALQRGRRALDDLARHTPADGLVCGIGHVNGDRFDDTRSRCAVLAYDYSVLAGTQGWQNHRKKDRLFEIAKRERLPVVFFTEGGGGRPGDVDAPGVAGLDCRAFQLFGELSGLVPLVGVNSGRCFAGNAALLGCCDVVIATANSSIGMGGPAMIEGGGLGVFHPDQVGPMAVQTRNGVVDVAVRDEAEAVAVAKAYLGYFQGAVADWACDDQRQLRALIPEHRLRIYDVRRVVDTLADTGSVLELRRDFGAGMVTALARVAGRPLGIIANHPGHLAGAIDPDGADKAARFMQLCDAFDLPLLFLCDTPGFMVGPDIEAHAMVRHAARLFVVGASLTVPFFTIVLRKGYGLGAQAMAGGSFHAPLFTVSWPTGEFGGMGLEGAVKLGFRKELEAIADPAERRARFEAMVARAYEIGQAGNVASHFEIDDVIDPAESRARILGALRAAPPPPPRTGKKRPCIDTW
jgi:acetyl-CoA carboxylase carboxyltransferase component/biotin carboxyl carrier protein